MDTKDLTARLRALMSKEGDLYFQYAEVAALADNEDALRQAADASGWFDSGRTFGTLKQYRTIGRAWMRPDGTFAWHPGFKWTTHAELATGPTVDHLTADERHQVLAENPTMTKRDARVYAGKKSMKDDASRPAAALRSILGDDAAIEDIAADPDALNALRDAVVAVEDRVHDGQERDFRKVGGELAELDASLALVADWQRVVRLAGKALRRQMSDGADEPARAKILTTLASLREIIAWAEDNLDSGSASFDAALSDLLASS